MEDDDIVLLTTVDIRPGVSRVLQLRQGDSPSSVAACFVQQNSLPEAVLRPLTEHLRQHLNLAEQVRRAGILAWGAAACSGCSIYLTMCCPPVSMRHTGLRHKSKIHILTPAVHQLDLRKCSFRMRLNVRLHLGRKHLHRHHLSTTRNLTSAVKTTLHVCTTAAIINCGRPHPHKQARKQTACLTGCISKLTLFVQGRNSEWSMQERRSA